MIQIGQVITLSLLFFFEITPAQSSMGIFNDSFTVSILSKFAIVVGIVIITSFCSTRLIKRFI